MPETLLVDLDALDESLLRTLADRHGLSLEDFLALRTRQELDEEARIDLDFDVDTPTRQ